METNFKVEWFITNKCNQKCDYCQTTEINKQENKIFQKQEVDILSKNLLSLNKDKYRFVFLGGEPTLYPNLYNLCIDLKTNFNSKLEKLVISTNCSRELNYFKKFLDLRDEIQIRFSMHPKYFSSDWEEKINFFLENNFDLYLDLLYDIKNIENTNKTIEIMKKLLGEKRANLRLSIKRIYVHNSFEVSYEKRNKKEKEIYQDIYNLIEKYNLEFGNKKKEKITNKKYCLVGSNKCLLSIDGKVLHMCKYIYNFKSIFLLPPKKFKEKLLVIRKCPFNLCVGGNKFSFPLQSDSLIELEKWRQDIINND